MNIASVSLLAPGPGAPDVMFGHDYITVVWVFPMRRIVYRVQRAESHDMVAWILGTHREEFKDLSYFAGELTWRRRI